MATFTLPGGGTLTGSGLKAAQASTATPINEIVLGDTSSGGTLGAQPLVLSGGGQLLFGPRAATFTLSGGGAFTFTGPQVATGAFTLSGGGALTFVGPLPVTATFTLPGGGDASLGAVAHRRKSFALHGGGAILGSGQRITIDGKLLPCAEWLLDLYPLLLGTPPAPPVPGLVLSLVDDSLDYSPGSLTAIVGNGTASGLATYSVRSGLIVTDVLTAHFDATGAAVVSVPVHVSAEGSYELIVTDASTSASASAPFTVALVITAATIGVPVTTPPTNVQPGSGVKKWVFQDPATGGVYHFAINPNKMNSPFAPKHITFTATTAIDGAKLAFEGQAAPVEWQFEGTLLTKGQYDAFVTWHDKRNRIWVTDHYGRAWLCYLTIFNPTPRRSHDYPWCHDYSITALIFEGPVTPS